MKLFFMVCTLFLQSAQAQMPRDTTAFTDEFNRINTNGSILGFWAGEEFQALRKKLGFKHFQGIQRLKNTNYVFLSSNTAKKGSLLHVVRLPSRAKSGKFGPNLDSEDHP